MTVNSIANTDINIFCVFVLFANHLSPPCLLLQYFEFYLKSEIPRFRSKVICEIRKADICERGILSLLSLKGLKWNKRSLKLSEQSGNQINGKSQQCAEMFSTIWYCKHATLSLIGISPLSCCNAIHVLRMKMIMEMMVMMKIIMEKMNKMMNWMTWQKISGSVLIADVSFSPPLFFLHLVFNIIWWISTASHYPKILCLLG